MKCCKGSQPAISTLCGLLSVREDEALLPDPQGRQERVNMRAQAALWAQAVMMPDRGFKVKCRDSALVRGRQIGQATSSSASGQMIFDRILMSLAFLKDSSTHLQDRMQPSWALMVLDSRKGQAQTCHPAHPMIRF